MNPIVTYQETELTEKQLVAITRLLYDIFVSDGRTYEEVLATVRQRIQERKGTPTESTRLVIWGNEDAVAHIGYFRREIYTQTEAIQAGALWGVAVRETHRGKGLGILLMKEFFNRIDQGEFSVSLWQTGVPDFYSKLGARVIHNPFVNSQDLENPKIDPWPDSTKMICPPDYPWPEGVIDLNGFGY